MASGMVSRWPVLVDSTIGVGDCDADGLLTTPAVERLLGEGRAAYFERCRTVDGSELMASVTSIRQDGAAAPGTSVTVVVGVVEIFASRFTMSARIRSTQADGIAADVTCDVAVDAVTPAMRDEFIALAHSASYVT